jgi:isoleucyl-tRNA synthetase
VQSDDEATLLEQVAAVREIVSAGLALRAASGIKVRQPLARLVVAGEAVSEELAAMARDEINVKQLDFAQVLPDGEAFALSGEDAGVRAALDIKVTDELREEGLAREIIRHGQVLRREAGYALDDRIILILRTEDEGLITVLKSQRELILAALQADDATEKVDREDAAVDTALSGHKLHLGVVKHPEPQRSLK